MRQNEWKVSRISANSNRANMESLSSGGISPRRDPIFAAGGLREMWQ
jgi:hypothetical protein